ncbi:MULTISPECIES: hypothetical protein [Paenibacillus]|nr:MULTISPECIES: hypothetical protein [Paenibacillus]
MITYAILGLAFLYTAIQAILLLLRRRKPVSREEIDERLLASLNGGNRPS